MEEIKDTIENAIQEQVEQPVVPQPGERLAAENLVLMRKKIEAAENRAKQAEERAAAAELARKQQIYPQPQQQSVDEDSEDPEDIVVNKKLKKTTARFNSELSQTKSDLNEMRQEVAYLKAQTTIASLSDFKEVVNDENLKTLASLYPEDYEGMMANPNPQSKIKHAYNMIKNYGILQATPIVKQTEQIKAADKKIEANKLKPGVAASAPVSNSPLTKFGRYNEDGRLILTDEDRDRINAETRRKLMQG